MSSDAVYSPVHVLLLSSTQMLKMIGRMQRRQGVKSQLRINKRSLNLTIALVELSEGVLKRP